MPVTIHEGRVILFGEHLCASETDLLTSKSFALVLRSFLTRLMDAEHPLLSVVKPFFSVGAEGETLNLPLLLQFLAKLYALPKSEVETLHGAFAEALSHLEAVSDFVEEFYNDWRSRERFFIHEAKNNASPEELLFFATRFKALVLSVYRSIAYHVSGVFPTVYRQVPAGAGVYLRVVPSSFHKEGVYQQLSHIPLIERVVMDPPLVYYPRENKRQGQFQLVEEQPLKEGMVRCPKDWLCLPIYVGDVLVFVYFRLEYLSLGVSLVNLFEVASVEQVKQEPPKGIAVFGVPNETMEGCRTAYYEDQDVVIGVVGQGACFDYLGYFKKMILTLHNTIMLNKGYLPVHGAMARIHRKKKTLHVVLIGDSGAGKSETLEAFRILQESSRSHIQVVFDDMGTLRILDQEVLGFGTEIGAFVRLDDLEPGFPYKEVDRSIFMNPQGKNARMVMPLTRSYHVRKGYEVELVLYMNNYHSVTKGEYLRIFAHKEEALKVFREGKRQSKGTTHEQGLTSTYFANPFGAPQKKERHEEIVEGYFQHLFEKKIPVGELYTQLGIPGFEQEGPILAAKALLSYVEDLN